MAALGLREVCLVLQKIKVQFQEFQVFFVGDDFVDFYSKEQLLKAVDWAPESRRGKKYFVLYRRCPKKSAANWSQLHPS